MSPKTKTKKTAQKTAKKTAPKKTPPKPSVKKGDGDGYVVTQDGVYKLPGHHHTFDGDSPLKLDSGVVLSPFTLAYQTYGTLNADKSNAILIMHGLTADQFVAETHPITGKDGWWDTVVGAGKTIDTDKYFVICINTISSCLGSTGPRSINPDTGKPWGISFPVITIGDMTRAQKMLLDVLGIDTLHAVVGASMGGMMAQHFAIYYPEHTQKCILIATASKYSPQNIGFDEIGRAAIMADPNWQGGHYYNTDKYPSRGLAVARMTAHITYLSEQALSQKFGRSLQDGNTVGFGFDADFQIESYLRHQGQSFVSRFDANSYLYITRAMDYFDLEHTMGKSTLADCFAPAKNVQFCLISFSSDWLFTTDESRAIVKALNAVGADVSFSEIQSDEGHDSFLLEKPDFWEIMQAFLANTKKSNRNKGV